jgi:hypothetical protein
MPKTRPPTAQRPLWRAHPPTLAPDEVISEQAWARLLPSLLALLLTVGCATAQVPPPSQGFAFAQDTFAFANELLWEYHFDPETDKASHINRQPKPAYHHRCFVLARSARQFFECAHFDPHQPIATADTYRKLVRRAVSMNPAKRVPPDERVVIPGYANLYQFSLVQEEILKETCGPAWQSYVQRGHWRMILPFSRRHQENTARRLVQALQANQAPVVHLVAFPSLRINHALVLFAYENTAAGIAFSAYDPNAPERPTTLTFDQTERAFSFPRNLYYRGGRLNVYDVYRSWLY